MFAMPRPPRRLRVLLERVFRLVALLAWVGQLAVVGAPLVEAGAESNRETHVEAGSNPLHHAHNPDLCPACAALALVGPPEARRAPLAEVPRAHLEPPPVRLARATAVESPHARPRAPPAGELVLRSEPRTEIDSLTTTNDAIRTLAGRPPAGRDGHGWRAAT